MPYNRFGDLYKCEVVSWLQEMGFSSVTSVHALNLVLEKMGVHERMGNGWLTTQSSVKYTIYNSRGLNVDGWHPSIINAVAQVPKHAATIQNPRF